MHIDTLKWTLAHTTCAHANLCLSIEPTNSIPNPRIRVYKQAFHIPPTTNPTSTKSSHIFIVDASHGGVARNYERRSKGDHARWATNNNRLHSTANNQQTNTNTEEASRWPEKTIRQTEETGWRLEVTHIRWEEASRRPDEVTRRSKKVSRHVEKAGRRVEETSRQHEQRISNEKKSLQKKAFKEQKLTPCHDEDLDMELENVIPDHGNNSLQISISHENRAANPPQATHTLDIIHLAASTPPTSPTTTRGRKMHAHHTMPREGSPNLKSIPRHQFQSNSGRSKAHKSHKAQSPNSKYRIGHPSVAWIPNP